MLSRPRPIALLHGTDQGSERSSDRERYAVPAFFARVLSHTESSLNVARAKKKKKIVTNTALLITALVRQSGILLPPLTISFALVANWINLLFPSINPLWVFNKSLPSAVVCERGVVTRNDSAFVQTKGVKWAGENSPSRGEIALEEVTMAVTRDDRFQHDFYLENKHLR